MELTDKLTVYVVLYDNYGNQGVEYCGVFSTIERAGEYITKRIKRERLGASERSYFDIVEEFVDMKC